MMIRTLPKAQILKDFQRHCQLLAKNNNEGYKQEFESLNDVGAEFPTRVGELEANQCKNRYQHVLPYDHCRVKLSLLHSQLHSDYINANYVPGGSSERDFICTQGPLQSTIADFWRMVWEQNVHIIVMLTSLKENGKVLCDQYWPPERGTGCYGDIQVTTVSRKRGLDSYITSIHLRQNGHPMERRITHYLYSSWPDNSVPRDLASLCAFTETVRLHLDNMPHTGPAIVHCSAGVGRSGTFVAVLWLLQLCVRGVSPDVKGAVMDLRRHRVFMVFTVEQYICVHKCLMRWLLAEGKKPKARTQSAPGLIQLGVPQPPQPAPQPHRQARPRSMEVKQTPKSHRQHQPSPAGPSVLQSFNAQLQSVRPANLLRRLLPSGGSTKKGTDSDL
ncbi:receptor-type tyrosine-protein phosphatase V-like isoform X2 [Engraulis encrasicolus]|uniref:receptor-type tyrosine-protein phosphatase V-like isoform X2 n=1 Tax=Engraulis encrasicolus TaxID=184585 RepID=UPI002FD301DA